jgi:response regulator RpfG family c-di-GMP phosphodiesterase
MSGTEMASQLRRMHPQIKVLLTSGYTDADIGQHDGLGADTPFIQKPFLPAALARKVREVLDK